MHIRLPRGVLPALALAALPALASAGVFVGVSVNIAPPALPVYVQPACPEAGYIWTPGYWGWSDGAYYWVPGTWVLPPEVGLLWTPGYWGWGDGLYLWHAGYWGPHVGFYGGVHYGFGYDGVGFEGGEWRGGVFFYNRAVAHVGPTFVRNVYYHTVVYHTTYEHVSFNGGPGGVRARPSREQMAAAHEHHFAFTSMQQRHQHMAFADHSLRADSNHGRPPVAATARPAVFHGNGAFAARAAGGPMRSTPVHHETSLHAGAAMHGGAPMRSDRPAWAGGQNHAAYAAPHSMEHGMPPRGQSAFDRPEPQRSGFSQQRSGLNSQRSGFSPQRSGFNPQANFEPRGNRNMGQPQARPQPQPQYRPSFRPQEQARGGPAPHAQQQRGGGEHRPPENRGGGHDHR